MDSASNTALYEFKRPEVCSIATAPRSVISIIFGLLLIYSALARRFSYRFRTTQWPAEKPVPAVFYDPRSVALDRSQTSALHAKCVVIDSKRLFVSSANFTEAAQQRNIEIGLLLDSELLASRIDKFFNDLVAKDF